MVCLSDILCCHSRIQTTGNGRQNTAGEIPQVRGKNHWSTKVGDNFRLMTMIKQTIGLQTHFTETVANTGFAPRATNTADGVNHGPLRIIEQTTLYQRFKC
ncbi:Uncharacterised protein [Yersinia enterocolitica]|nr:Uncharacterised protein [Yersinia enterocolitica]